MRRALGSNPGVSMLRAGPIRWGPPARKDTCLGESPPSALWHTAARPQFRRSWQLRIFARVGCNRRRHICFCRVRGGRARAGCSMARLGVAVATQVLPARPTNTEKTRGRARQRDRENERERETTPPPPAQRSRTHARAPSFPRGGARNGDACPRCAPGASTAPATTHTACTSHRMAGTMSETTRRHRPHRC